MEKIRESSTHEYYRDFFEGKEVVFLKNKITNEIHVSAESVAGILGFNNAQEMLSDDKVLDLANVINNKTGKFPIKKINHEE